MGPWKPVIIMVVNYSHDIATALLAASGAALWLLAKNLPAEPTPATAAYFIGTYGSVSRVARDSLYWILLAGVPRIIFYREYEWSVLAGNLQVAAIVVKHIVMFVLVGGGIYYWVRLGRQVALLRELTPADEHPMQQ